MAVPLRFLAAAVAYSRVHSGVHYPGDVVVGSLVGGAVGLMPGSLVAAGNPTTPKSHPVAEPRILPEI